MLWLAVSDDELDREGDDNKGGGGVKLSGDCRPLGWWWIDQGIAGLADPDTDDEDDTLHGRF